MLSKDLIEKIANCADNAAFSANKSNDSAQIVKEIFAKTDTMSSPAVSAFEAGRLFERISKYIEGSKTIAPIQQFDSTSILKKLESVESEFQKDNMLFDEVLPYLQQ